MPVVRNKRKINQSNVSKWPFIAGLVLLIAVLGNQARILTQGIFQQKKPFPTDVLIPSINPVQNTYLSQADYKKKAVDDLSGLLHIDVDKIRVVRIIKKEFSDTSLGCPKLGKMYAQVITPGYQIVLEVDGESYIYNAGLNIVITC